MGTVGDAGASPVFERLARALLPEAHALAGLALLLGGELEEALGLVGGEGLAAALAPLRGVLIGGLRGAVLGLAAVLGLPVGGFPVALLRRGRLLLGALLLVGLLALVLGRLLLAGWRGWWLLLLVALLLLLLLLALPTELSEGVREVLARLLVAGSGAQGFGVVGYRGLELPLVEAGGAGVIARVAALLGGAGALARELEGRGGLFGAG